MSDKNELRFAGVARLYGDEALTIFQRSHVAIIGIGGVGSWVAEGLARSGIGQFTLIDLDEICITNVNRQIHAITETVGLSKTEVMKKRIMSINPSCVVNEINDFVGYANLEDCMSHDYDFV
ncbi:MAG: tRNA A37 threonylcarbamoyladenosine dehydratase, partial [Enterobacterales bacterium]